MMNDAWVSRVAGFIVGWICIGFGYWWGRASERRRQAERADLCEAEHGAGPRGEWLREGKVEKGGVNSTTQVTERPPAPDRIYGQFRPTHVSVIDGPNGPEFTMGGTWVPPADVAGSHLDAISDPRGANSRQVGGA